MEKQTFAYKLGRFLASLFWACITVCLSSALLALTAKFIMWLL